jgi:hypothetical protein
MGIDPNDFECILDQEDVMGYLDDCVLTEDDDEEE